MWLVIIIILGYLIVRYGFLKVLLVAVAGFAISCLFAWICETIIKKVAKNKKISDYRARNIVGTYLKWIVGITIIIVLLVMLIFFR